MVALIAALALLAVAAGTTLGATSLQGTPIAWDEPKNECNGDELPNKVLWYFVLTGPTEAAGTLTAQFEQAGSKASAGSSQNGDLHFVIVTGLPDTLLSAETDTDGAQLNLTHVCAMQVSEPFPEPTASPEPTPKPTPAPTPKPTPKPTPAPTTPPTSTSEPAPATQEPVEEPEPSPTPTTEPTPQATPVEVAAPVTAEPDPEPEPVSVVEEPAEPSDEPVPAVVLSNDGTPPAGSGTHPVVLIVVLAGLAVGVTTMALTARRSLRRRPLTRVLG